MSKRVKYAIAGSAVLAVVLILTWLTAGGELSVLDTRGSIAAQQRDLMYAAVGLMLLVVIPVFALTFHIAWKYRAGNKHARYTPDWDSDRRLEAIWWGFPTLIIAILSVIIWQSSHALDPYKPLASHDRTMTIQVVALQWKWLFIYPDQNIASVNYLRLPHDVPVRFDITADAPMNSFWIPQLGGQVYAMSGMKTQLHLVADEPGNFRGVSANLSGSGFADMHFIAEATGQAEFDAWVQSVRQAPDALSLQAYDELARPSRELQTFRFSSTEPDLHTKIVEKYDGHGAGTYGQTGGDHQQPARKGGDHEGH